MSEIEQVPQTTLRDTLGENFDAAEAGTLETPEQVQQRARDEQGRFAKEEKKVEPKVEKAEPEKTLPRPTTWKKEYLPIWDKLTTGQPLTKEEANKLAEYTGHQRENEYKTGVSTYRQEAMAARELQEAVTPFMPELQAHNLKPADWIKQLGQAHYVLVRGTPDQKLGVFNALARTYGVPLAAMQAQGQGQLPPLVQQLMQQNADLVSKVNALEGRVAGVADWRQQFEVSALEEEVRKAAGDTQTYPHFEKLREPMAQLLESGAAKDIPTAYKLALRGDDELMEQDIQQRLLQKQSEKAEVARQAKAKAVSPKSSTPSGQVKSEAKDRRSMLSELLDEAQGGRV